MCSTSATLTITDSAQATSLVNCDTYTGSIAVAQDYVGDLQFLDTLADITGTLNATFVHNLTSITANGLRTIGGDFVLESLYSLRSLAFPELAATNALSWIYLGPALQNLGFASLSNVNDLTITGSFFQSLQGLNLNSAATMEITLNPYLTNITLPLTGSSDSITISDNAYGNSSLHLPNLQNVGNFVVRNCTMVNLPSLYSAIGAVSFINNSFQTLDLPLLVTSGGLEIEDSPSLTQLNLPVYDTTSSGLSVQNNTMLNNMISFPNLTNITGDATFVGSFSGISLPKLELLTGAVVLQSTENINSTCTDFQSIHGSNETIKGELTCVYPGTTFTYPNPTSTSTSNSSTTTVAVATTSTGHPTPVGAIVGGVVGGLVVLVAAIAVFLIMRSRHRRKIRALKKPPDDDEMRPELDQAEQRGELAAGPNAVELDPHHATELETKERPLELAISMDEKHKIEEVYKLEPEPENEPMPEKEEYLPPELDGREIRIERKSNNF